MKKLLLFLIFIISTFGCGYRIAGLHTGGVDTYYITGIYNNSSDLTITTEMSSYITKYFYDNGMLRDREEATYLIEITLIKRNVTDSSISTTRQATSSELELVYHIIITEHNGRTVYERSLRDTTTFSTGNSITAYNNNLKDAFETITKDILSGFKYAITTTN